MRASILALLAARFLAAQSPGFSPANLDRSANPCVDFYQFACGTWVAKNQIPLDQAAWGRFNELEERNEIVLRGILEKASADDPKRSSNEQKIGDFYASCMDEKAIDAKGTAPIQPELDRIAAVRDLPGLASEIAHLQSIGTNVLFEFGAGPDFKDSSMDIAQADQGGLGLPDRDYYLKTDAKSVTLRTQYVAHLQRMFQLLGNSQTAAAKKAAVVMRIETALAKGSLDRVSRRDPSSIYHKLGMSQLAALSPSFAWPKYLQDIHAPTIGSLNVAAPDFFKQLQTLLSQTSLDDWKTYLAWHLAHSESHLLSAPFVQANFDFYGKILTGTKELKPRWK